MLEFHQLISDLGKHSLDNCHTLRLRVVSGSMEPVLRVGDELLVSAFEYCELRCGDLVVFRGNHGFLTHRIIDVTPKAIVTKGDAWYKPDSPVSKDDIIGIVRVRENYRQVNDFRIPRWVAAYLRNDPPGKLRELTSKGDQKLEESPDIFLDIPQKWN